VPDSSWRWTLVMDGTNGCGVVVVCVCVCSKGVQLALAPRQPVEWSAPLVCHRVAQASRLVQARGGRGRWETAFIHSFIHSFHTRGGGALLGPPFDAELLQSAAMPAAVV
jgi:hypothetical protein